MNGVSASVSGAADGPTSPTVMDAVRDQAEAVLADTPSPTKVLGIGEVRRGRPALGRGRPGPSATACR
jgi:hypothetical protein